MPYFCIYIACWGICIDSTDKLHDMKKIHAFYLTFFAAVTVSHSQTAPDFNFTDINGGDHNLYTALENGYIVLFDIFFVDCGPCQITTPYLQDIHDDYAGKNVVVFSISDHSEDTNAYIAQYDDIYGYSFYRGGPQGGGVQVVNTYANQFNFIGYPTVSVICPDKLINWDIWPVSNGAPQWRAAIEACGVEDAPPYQPLNTSVVEPGPTQNDLRIAPNPVSASTWLSFSLTEGQEVRADIFNMMGQRAATTIVFQGDAGENSIFVPTQQLIAGAYQLRISTATGEVRSAVMIKE